MRKFGLTYRHGTAFPQEECLHRKDATGMENPNMYCSSPWKNPTYLCGSFKLPRFRDDNIGPRIEICEFSGLPIPMVPHFHKRNVYIKRKLRVWRTQKYIALVGAETVLTSAGQQTTPFHGGQYTVGNANMRKFGATFQYGTAFPQEECLYLKESTGMEWRAQKCIALVGAETVLTSAGPQTTPFHGDQYMDQNGNMRNFGPTNPHGTSFTPKQWLYQKEAAGMESSKMYCPSWC